MMTDQFSPQIWHRYVGELWGFTQKQIKTTWPEYMDEGSKDRKMFDDVGLVAPDLWQQMDAVSYTHLTLPTNREV